MDAALERQKLEPSRQREGEHIYTPDAIRKATEEGALAACKQALQPLGCQFDEVGSSVVQELDRRLTLLAERTDRASDSLRSALQAELSTFASRHDALNNSLKESSRALLETQEEMRRLNSVVRLTADAQDRSQQSSMPMWEMKSGLDQLLVQSAELKRLVGFNFEEMAAQMRDKHAATSGLEERAGQIRDIQAATSVLITNVASDEHAYEQGPRHGTYEEQHRPFFNTSESRQPQTTRPVRMPVMSPQDQFNGALLSDRQDRVNAGGLLPVPSSAGGSAMAAAEMLALQEQAALPGDNFIRPSGAPQRPMTAGRDRYIRQERALENSAGHDGAALRRQLRPRQLDGGPPRRRSVGNEGGQSING